jgi:hypothetical protein
MAVIFDQKPESGSWNLAKGEGVREYQLIGTAGEFPNDVAAGVFLRTAVPLFYSGAWLQDIQFKPQGNGLWYVTCPYGKLPRYPGGGGSIRINFRTTGGTVHISASRSMVAKYGTGAPDTVVIGQDGSGAEITVPVQMRSYTYNFESGVVTEAAMDYWEAITGVVNAAAWRGRPAGEVLFLGAEGDTTISADSSSSVTFQFAMSRNKTGQTIGAITGIAKEGHDLLDIHTKTVVVSSQDVQQEKYVYVQRVYERLNFSTYLGF